MKKNLSEMIRQLEEQGIDTSKFSINIDGKDLNEFLEASKENVEHGTVKHKTFRRWILAQTWKMLTTPVYDPKDKHYKIGWESYMRLNYDYKYQFDVLLDELKVLSKMQKHCKNIYSEEYETRKLFFTLEVVLKTCKHAIDLARKNSVSYNAYFRNKLELQLEEAELIYEIMTSLSCNDYYSIRVLLENYVNNGILNYINSKERKCQEWKDAYKAAGAYYSLQNMILYHDCALAGYGKNQSYNSLKRITNCYASNNELWRLHQLMIKTIECNNFNLARSIEKGKK